MFLFIIDAEAYANNIEEMIDYKIKCALEIPGVLAPPTEAQIIMAPAPQDGDVAA